MAFTKALDVSVYQGHINWAAVKAAGYDIAMIKVSGDDGPNGEYIDGLCGEHYNGALAAGLHVGTYHFAGTHDSPEAQADYFIQVCTPLDENQVLILDWETSLPNPVDFCGRFAQRVHDKCGVWPILYMNGSTANAYNWNADSRVANCGKWIAWYGKDPNNDLPVNETYIIHQYTSTGAVPGIAGNVDLDAVYMTVETWDKYGYHAPTQPPAPTPAPAQPALTPAPAPDPVPVTPPVVEPPVTPLAPQPLPSDTTASVPDATVTVTPAPVSIPVPQPLPAPVVKKPVTHWYDFILALLRALHLIK